MSVNVRNRNQSFINFIKEYHAYKHPWKSAVNEQLNAAMEPDNVGDKNAVCVKMDKVT